VSADQSPREILLANLPLIHELVSFIAQRHHLSPTHAEELESFVRFKVLDNDYGIIARWKRTCSLRTYLTVVVGRLFLDYCNKVWGKWRPSAAAIRLGPLAQALEEQLYREGLSFGEACEVLGQRHGVTRAELQALLEKLPRRGRHPRLQSLDPDLGTPSPLRNPEEDALQHADETAVTRAVASSLRRMPAGERLLLRLRFSEGISVTAIARGLSQPPRRLFRKFDSIMAKLRRELLDAGFDRDDVAQVLAGRPNLDFGLQPDEDDDDALPSWWESRGGPTKRR
jgi:DNA-directed RNA polymerase specialized sigma24 family protein